MLLGIDTSSRSVGIVLYDGEQILCEESWISRRYHTVELAGAVSESLVRAGLNPSDLDVLGVAIGPGSFTGLRIGLALIKGLSYTLQLPVISVPTLDISARGIPPSPGLLAAILQAGRTRLAVGWYRAEDGVWQPQGDPENLSTDELIQKVSTPTIITGELSPDLRNAISGHDQITPAPPIQAQRSPKYLAALAWERWSAGDVDDVLALKPFYLHRDHPIPG